MGAGLGKCEILFPPLPGRPAARCFEVESRPAMSGVRIVLGRQLSFDLSVRTGVDRVFNTDWIMSAAEEATRAASGAYIDRMPDFFRLPLRS